MVQLNCVKYFASLREIERTAQAGRLRQINWG